MWEYQATVVSVHDGDTYTLDIDLGFYVHTVQHIRLEGANAPELDTAAGQAALQYVEGLLPAGTMVTVVTRQLPIRSFERYVAVVRLSDGRDLAQVLIATGQAVPMAG